MVYKILNLIIILFLFAFIINGDPVSELKADEENYSECFKTSNPKGKSDCLEKEVAEDDTYCCFFEIETHKKKKEQKCAGLTEFQYNHIKLYVKEKMDELLYRDLHIDCNSVIIKICYSLFLFLLF
jgi:hypothetical protein